MCDFCTIWLVLICAVLDDCFVIHRVLLPEQPEVCRGMSRYRTGSMGIVSKGCICWRQSMGLIRMSLSTLGIHKGNAHTRV
jgi:hypothetical protein